MFQTEARPDFLVRIYTALQKRLAYCNNFEKKLKEIWQLDPVINLENNGHILKVDYTTEISLP
jgi:hypothetical protein